MLKAGGAKSPGEEGGAAVRRREEILDILKRHLGAAVAAAHLEAVADELALSLDPLGPAWEEVEGIEEEMGYHVSVLPPDICKLEEMVKRGTPVKVFKKREG